MFGIKRKRRERVSDDSQADPPAGWKHLPERYRPAYHCRINGCLCTHTDPCQFGWIENEPRERNGQTYASVRPCTNCRPAQANRLRDESVFRGEF